MEENKYYVGMGGRTDEPLVAIAKMIHCADQILDTGGEELHDAGVAMVERAWHELGKWIEREKI